MAIVNLTIFWILMMAGWVWAGDAVDIFISGKKFGSIEAYRAFKNTGDGQGPEESLGLAKTIEFQDTEEPQEFKQLRTIGYEDGVHGVLVDFHQNWDDPTARFVIPAAELEDRLRAVAGDRQDPVMVVSDANKVRVMALGNETPSP